MPGRDDESWEKLNGSCEDVQYPIYYIYNYQVKSFLIKFINQVFRLCRYRGRYSVGCTRSQTLIASRTSLGSVWRYSRCETGSFA